MRTLDPVGPDRDNAPVIRRSMIRCRGGRLAIAAALCLLAAALAGPGEALAQGCAMCATALKGSNDPLTRSFAFSSILMLSMPFTLFASVAGYFWLRRFRRPADQTDVPTEMHSDAPEEALR